eukprot:GILJ01004432.1.p1 GENE.GILJ01004432.1~~GILJ01004432.1.p1  ORF type:complete len:240 (+),score=33.29 GILJ01004432.1:97-816(+)
MDRDNVFKLSAKAPAAILQRVLELKRAQNADNKSPQPRVTLMLSSGHTVSGWVIDISENDPRNNSYAHIALSTDDLDVVYLPVGTISGLIVHAMHNFAHNFAFGKQIRPPRAPVPTRLELKKKMKNSATLASSAFNLPKSFTFDATWDSIAADNSEALYCLDTVVDSTVEALQHLAADELAKDVIARKLDKVMFTVVGGTCSIDQVKLERDTLIIPTANVEPFTSLTRGALAAAIEACF